uniref:Uncharacterized protein n=1 Tax=Trichuris muris TaxID=70415 RepID=A0A5S6QCK6_TRIMR
MRRRLTITKPELITEGAMSTTKRREVRKSDQKNPIALTTCISQSYRAKSRKPSGGSATSPSLLRMPQVWAFYARL